LRQTGFLLRDADLILRSILTFILAMVEQITLYTNSVSKLFEHRAFHRKAHVRDLADPVCHMREQVMVCGLDAVLIYLLPLQVEIALAQAKAKYTRCEINPVEKPEWCVFSSSQVNRSH
jgi:hypothetical protein